MTYPKIGIRPTIDGRWGGVRESLEAQTMGMATAAKALIEENLHYPDGTPVQCVLSPTTIAFAIAATGLSVHFGYTGLLNFGMAAFMALGAYGFVAALQPGRLPLCPECGRPNRARAKRCRNCGVDFALRRHAVHRPTWTKTVVPQVDCDQLCNRRFVFNHQDGGHVSHRTTDSIFSIDKWRTSSPLTT